MSSENFSGEVEERQRSRHSCVSIRLDCGRSSERRNPTTNIVKIKNPVLLPLFQRTHLISLPQNFTSWKLFQLSNVPCKMNNAMENTTIWQPRRWMQVIFLIAFPAKCWKSWLQQSNFLEKLLQLWEISASKPTLPYELYFWIQDFTDIGHLQKTPQNGLQNAQTNYMNYYYVHKLDNTTTQITVVFDANTKTTKELSLEDCYQLNQKQKNKIFSWILWLFSSKELWVLTLQ